MPLVPAEDIRCCTFLVRACDLGSDAQLPTIKNDEVKEKEYQKSIDEATNSVAKYDRSIPSVLH